LGAELVKGVFNSDEGAYGYNIAGDFKTQTQLNDCQESRVEIMSTQLSDEWGRQLLECVIQAATITWLAWALPTARDRGDARRG